MSQFRFHVGSNSLCHHFQRHIHLYHFSNFLDLCHSHSNFSLRNVSSPQITRSILQVLQWSPSSLLPIHHQELTHHYLMFHAHSTARATRPGTKSSHAKQFHVQEKTIEKVMASMFYHLVNTHLAKRVKGLCIS